MTQNDKVPKGIPIKTPLVEHHKHATTGGGSCGSRPLSFSSNDKTSLFLLIRSQRKSNEIKKKSLQYFFGDLNLKNGIPGNILIKQFLVSFYSGLDLCLRKFLAAHLHQMIVVARVAQ